MLSTGPVNANRTGGTGCYLFPSVGFSFRCSRGRVGAGISNYSRSLKRATTTKRWIRFLAVEIHTNSTGLHFLAGRSIVGSDGNVMHEVRFLSPQELMPCQSMDNR